MADDQKPLTIFGIPVVEVPGIEHVTMIAGDWAPPRFELEVGGVEYEGDQVKIRLTGKWKRVR